MTASVLTQAQFNQACKGFIRARTSHSARALPRNVNDWQWHDNAATRALGFMSRVGSAFRKSSAQISSNTYENEELIEDDTSTAAPNGPMHSLLIVHQYVVYSPTFQVPAFYFTAHDSDGSSLPLQQILESTLFHSHGLPENTDIAPHGISLPSSNFPLLSQGDHPVLGTPCWYFHPCETSTAVVELLAESNPQDDQTADERLLRWLEVWFLVLCNVIDLR